jgi:transposase-like protein
VDKASLELLLAQGVSIEKIARRFDRDPATISYWVRKHGLESPYRGKHAAKGGIEKERLETLVDDGATIAEIAADVGVSKATVRYWLKRYGLRTKNGRGRRADETRAAKAAGLLITTRVCSRHGETQFLLEGRGYYRCMKCRSDAVSRRRRKVKEILVREAGGCCAICGYDRCFGALEFHHLDPGEKRLEVNAKGVSLALETLRAEAQKCILLCANCHAEVERGLATLPATVQGGPDEYPIRLALGHSPIHHNPG